MTEKAEKRAVVDTRDTIVLSGDRPTGKLHLGHFVGTIQGRLKLEKNYRQFIMVADIQALTDNAENPEKIRKHVLEVTLDNLAAGLDPKHSTFFIQSLVPEIAELTVLFLNLVTLARLERNPTVKDEMRQKGYERNVPAGFLTYPVSQAADILALRATLIPVGKDQLPMIEQANEIVEKFNRLYPSSPPVFGHIEVYASDVPLLPGTDGKAKMSKSLNNAIFLSDSNDIIREKVMQMYTDPNHIHETDPGTVKDNVVFTYLDIFAADRGRVRDLKDRYEKGGLGDVALKNHLIEILAALISPIKERREYLAKRPDDVMDILRSGTEIARAVAGKTLADVRRAMRINYF